MLNFQCAAPVSSGENDLLDFTLALHLDSVGEPRVNLPSKVESHSKFT